MGAVLLDCPQLTKLLSSQDCFAFFIIYAIIKLIIKEISHRSRWFLQLLILYLWIKLLELPGLLLTRVTVDEVRLSCETVLAISGIHQIVCICCGYCYRWNPTIKGARLCTVERQRCKLWSSLIWGQKHPTRSCKHPNYCWESATSTVLCSQTAFFLFIGWGKKGLDWLA